jgi:exosortase A-associated hydrolase 1
MNRPSPSFREDAFLFDARAESRARLVGIVTLPDGPAPTASLGVLIVVGGPQYRVGSHRQFVLLARALAARGFAVMRFDCAGMGDSAGVERPFTDRDDDIGAAVDAFVARVPSLDGVVLWGLCDAASAALLYAPRDSRVTQLVLLNPWVRSDAGLARTHLKHYYGSRLADRAFWSGLLRGEVGVWRALKGFVGTLITARRGASDNDAALDFQTRMARGWQRFAGDILLICSGDDLTAREFIDHAASDGAWAGLVEQKRVVRCDLADADHTFSRAEWRDRVADWTAQWLETRTVSTASVAQPMPVDHAQALQREPGVTA